MGRRFTRPGIMAGVLVAVALAAGVAGTALAAQTAVTIKGFAFSPATVTLKVGDTVTWSNQDAVGHTATAEGGAFDTGVIAGGSSATVTLTKAGSYTYHCMIHPTMTGTIIVEAAAVATPRATTGSTIPPTDTIGAASSGTHGDGNGWLLLAGLAVAGIASLLAVARRTTARVRARR